MRLEINESAYVAFTADGSTDRTHSHHLIVYVFYVYRGKLCCAFVDLVDCKGDAESITRAILTALGRELSQKLVAGAADGASVMLGGKGFTGKNNVRALMQRRFPFLHVIHCTAHCHALASADACAATDFVVSLCEGVTALSNEMGFSYVKRAEYKQFAELAGEKALQPGKIHKVRWLSRGQAFETTTRTLVGNLLTVQKYATALAARKERRRAETQVDETQAEKESNTEKCAALTLRAEFALSMPIVNNMLKLQNSFNKLFQGAQPAYIIKFQRDELISQMKSLYIDQPDVLKFKTFNKDVKGKSVYSTVGDELQRYEFKPRHLLVRTPSGHELTLNYDDPSRSILSSKQRALKYIEDGIREYAQNIVDSLKARFTDETLQFWSALQVCDVDRMQAMEDGVELSEDLLLLANHFPVPWQLGGGWLLHSLAAAAINRQRGERFFFVFKLLSGGT